jgi:nucleotide-binding universal stress UspA family protein
MTPDPSCVLAAIDLGPSSARVLHHAAGFARVFNTKLLVLHVSEDSMTDRRQSVLDFCARHAPYEVDLGEEDIVVRTGLVSSAIHREALRQRARLVVIGSRGHSRVATLLLGSSSEAVLRDAPAPVLLVPSIDLDIVNISDRARLTCGPVLVAIDLSDPCEEQLRWAAEVAFLAGQPLLMLTVAPRNLSDHRACAMLRQRADEATPVKPRALIVRHGDIAEEISRCALTEGAGLVVMGLRAGPRGQPGVIASAVLRTNRAFVLAVPVPIAGRARI